MTSASVGGVRMTVGGGETRAGALEGASVCMAVMAARVDADEASAPNADVPGALADLSWLGFLGVTLSLSLSGLEGSIGLAASG